MIEEWRPVLGYEGWYEVSDQGRVKRVRAVRGATVGRVLSLRKPNRTNDYCRVQLCKYDNKRSYGVHVLVAEAFHGKRPRGKFPNHKDLDKTNNRASNLEWVTRRQNILHALQNGKKPSASLPRTANGRAKLTDAQVAEIIAQKGKVGQRVLAALFGVSKSAIQFIHQGKHWKIDSNARCEWPEVLRVREFPHVSR